MNLKKNKLDQNKIYLILYLDDIIFIILLKSAFRFILSILMKNSSRTILMRFFSLFKNHTLLKTIKKSELNHSMKSLDNF